MIKTTLSPRTSGFTKTSLAGSAVGYLAVIVYGSLLPFQWNALPLSTALANFQHVPLLTLGVQSRADLVANLLLYIPFGFLLCGLLTGENRRPSVLVTGMLLSLLFAMAAAVAVEFTQQFFAPRTVSLNDILAESAGSIIGISLWPFIGPRLMQLSQTISQGSAKASHALLISYAVVYAALSIFPYDFLLSYDEWQEKLISGNTGPIFAPNCGGNCILRLIPEALLVVPLAILLFGPARSRPPFATAAIAGAILGVLIEGVQLTIASGISQGASVISKSAGMMLGVGLMQLSPSINWRQLRQYARPILALAVLPYLVGLVWLNGWLSGHWLSLSEGWPRLRDVHFLPFYYHYFSTETVALTSLLFQSGLYLPIGAGLLIWQLGGRSSVLKQNFRLPALLGGSVASVIEAGKLFIPDKHPDPTNVVIAATAAMGAYWLLHSLTATESSSSVPSTQPHPTQDRASPRPFWTIVISIPSLFVALWAALTAPLGTSYILPAFIAYATLLWWRPGLWLICVLALLPLLDLTQWSGRLFWTEFDTALLVTIGVTYLRLGSTLPGESALRGPGRLLFSLFILSSAVSLVIGLFPIDTFDHNAFSNYTSPYNALRVGKSLAFILALLPLVAFEWKNPKLAAHRLTAGMILGLAGTVGYILWERVTFPGLFNFENDYRITGPFPGMHVGGAYIEAYLTASLPFVALFAWQQQRTWATVLAVVLYGLGAYSVMVTFSRGGQAAFALATLIILLGFSRMVLHEHLRRFSNMIAVILLAGVATAISWPIVTGAYSQWRWASTEHDLGVRAAHWADALNIVRTQNASLLGMGLGSFPSAYFWNSSASTRPATYVFVIENGNNLLRLGSGDPLYFEQVVPVVPEQQYTLKLDMRSEADNAALTVALCEKSLLYSYVCTFETLRNKASAKQWGHYEAQIRTTGFGPPGSGFPRPVTLSIYNIQAGTVIDVDNVVLRTAAGEDLVRNGDFSRGMHHWFFSVDNYWPWHVENLFLSVFFEQGWFGFAVFLALVFYMMATRLPRAWRNDPLSLVLCASFAAFFMVGLLNSWSDEPRLSFLFYLLLLAGIIEDTRLRTSGPSTIIPARG